ncbi:MAG: CHASE2 domain-containing protein, partial [Desulfobacterales bacterium]
MRASAKRKLRTRVLLVIGALIISHIIHGAFPHKAENWDSRIIDRLFTLRPKVNHVKEAHQDSIVHVDVNFYFSRPQHARIIRNLAAMNVSAQLIDFILPDMISEQEDQALIEATKKAESVYFGLEFESLGKQSAEGGKSSYTAGRPIPDSAKWQVIVDGSRESILSGIKPSAPYDALISASRGLGFIHMTSDSDGIIRRLPLLVQHQDHLYPSLALRVICDYLKVPPQ